MKTYKAIFDLPDDIIPPPVVGFQIVVPTNQPQPTPNVQTYTAPLLPITYHNIEDGTYTEVTEKGENE